MGVVIHRLGGHAQRLEIIAILIDRAAWRFPRQILRPQHVLLADVEVSDAEASREAIELLARHDAILLDPTYTAKAMAALIAYVREDRFRDDQTVLFWHTGGQVNLFA